jgi:thiosulfate/3-mercaptopyruvate sulfurtransferase
MVDCSFELGKPESGANAYVAAHIPGAVYAHLEAELSDMSECARHGRHPLPTAAGLGAALARLGIERDSQVVAYDQDSGAYAARLWWLLRAAGYPDVRVLDGGLRAWRAAGMPLDTGAAIPRSVDSAPPVAPDRAAWLDVETLQQHLAQDTIALVDARGGPRFRGEVEPIDPVAGHVPGARNRPFLDNLDASGRFKPAEQLRDEFAHLLAGRTPDSVVHMCGSGVTACHNLLAMEIAGLPGSRLYADSWSGWIRDPARSVAVGP